jgi:hypothetical protein
VRLVLLALTLMVARTATAQTDELLAEDFIPSALNQPAQEFPQVNSQHNARFRVEAPDGLRGWLFSSRRVFKRWLCSVLRNQL